MGLKKKFYRKVLSNGMTIILEKRDLPIVSVAIGVRNGGANDSISEKGISHFIEHMLYKGTKKRKNSKLIAEEIENKGGELNGFTGEDLTAYWCKMPSKHLGFALDVLTDLVCNSVFDKKELDKERKVIFEEIKMRRDTPLVFIFDEIQKSLYENPFGFSIIGTEKILHSITQEKILAKFKAIYTPNNFLLCVAGDCDFNKLVKFAEKNFGDKKGEVPSFKIKLKNESKIIERSGIDQANLILAYHVPLIDNKKNYASRVLSTLLGGGLSSRLFVEIREKRNLAYSIKAGSDISLKHAHAWIYVGTKKENVEKVKKLILKELKKVYLGLGESELKLIKEQMIGNYHISMEDSVSQMENLLHFEANGGADEFYRFEEKISNVKLKEVKQIAKDAFNNYSFIALVPKK
jgi:predicted Zn-dependent peptidase